MPQSDRTTIDVNDILQGSEQLKTRRSQFESQWKKSADTIFPRMNVFDNMGSPSPQNAKKKTVVYSRPMIALTRFASGYNSMITPSGSKWHDLAMVKSGLEQEGGVSDWLVEGRDTLFKERYSGQSGFAAQQYEKYISLGLFGTGIMAINPNPKGGIMYKTHHIAEHYMMENHNGRIDVDYHVFKLNGKQALERYGDDLDDKTHNLAVKNSNDQFDFIHLVKPNPDYDPTSMLSEKKKFISIHVDVAGNKIMRVSGFNTFPYAVSRYVTIPNDVYGTGAAQLVLPDILMANEMSRTGLVSKKLRGLPPVLVKNDGIVTPAGGGKIDSGKLIKGGLDASGNPNMKPYLSGSDPVTIDNEISRSDDLIDEAFLASIFRILTDTKRMTATEVMERLEEKADLLAPLMGREQTESLSIQVEREIDILVSQGRYPELPPALAERQQDGDIDYEIVYTSPLAQAQKAKEALGVIRTVGTAMEFANADQEVLDNINFDKAIEIVNDSNVGNKTIMNDEGTIKKIREQRALQQAALAAAAAEGGELPAQ